MVTEVVESGIECVTLTQMFRKSPVNLTLEMSVYLN